MSPASSMNCGPRFTRPCQPGPDAEGYAAPTCLQGVVPGRSKKDRGPEGRAKSLQGRDGSGAPGRSPLQALQQRLPLGTVTAPLTSHSPV